MTVLEPINGGLLDKLMTEHQNRLYSMALQILRNSGKGTEEDAADLVQDTFNTKTLCGFVEIHTAFLCYLSSRILARFRTCFSIIVSRPAGRL